MTYITWGQKQGLIRQTPVGDTNGLTHQFKAQQPQVPVRRLQSGSDTSLSNRICMDQPQQEGPNPVDTSIPLILARSRAMSTATVTHSCGAVDQDVYQGIRSIEILLQEAGENNRKSGKNSGNRDERNHNNNIGPRAIPEWLGLRVVRELIR